MLSYDVIKAAAARRGVALSDIGRALGKRDNYVASMRGRSIGVDNYTAILGACDFVLCAVPREDVPAGALVIESREDHAANA